MSVLLRCLVLLPCVATLCCAVLFQVCGRSVVQAEELRQLLKGQGPVEFRAASKPAWQQ